MITPPTPSSDIIHHVSTLSLHSANSTADDLVDFAQNQWQTEYRSSCELSGYLNKRSKVSYYNRWQKRWFVLKNDVLFYFRKQCDDNPVGVLFLDSSLLLEDASREIGAEFCIALTVDSSCSLESRKSYQRRTYYFAALNKTDFTSWMFALRGAKSNLPVNSRECDRVSGNQPVKPLRIPRAHVDVNNTGGGYFDRPLGWSAFCQSPSASSVESELSVPLTITPAPSASNHTSSFFSDYSHGRKLSNPSGNVFLRRSHNNLGYGTSGNRMSNELTQEKFQPQNIQSQYSQCQKQIAEFTSLLRLSLMDSSASPASVDFLDPVTTVVRHIRYILFFADEKYTKQIRNPSFASCVTRHMTAVIERSRQVGFEAKQLPDLENMKIKRDDLINDLMLHIESLSKELQSFMEISKNVYDVDFCLRFHLEFTDGLDEKISEKIKDILTQCVEISQSFNTQTIDFCLRYITVLISFIKSFLSSASPEMIAIIGHGIDDFLLNGANRRNNLVLDTTDFRSSYETLEQMAESLERLSNYMKYLPPLNAILTISDVFFSVAAYLLRFLFTLGVIEKHLGETNNEDPQKVFAFLLETIGQLTLFLPPDDLPDDKLHNSAEYIDCSSERNIMNEIESTLTKKFTNLSNNTLTASLSLKSTHHRPFQEPQRTRSPIFSTSSKNISKELPSWQKNDNCYHEKPDENAINEVVFRTVSELGRIATESARSLKSTLTSFSQTLDTEATDTMYYFAEGMITASAQIEEEMGALEGHHSPTELLVNLEDARQSLLRASSCMEFSFKNWMSTVAPSSSRSNMIENISSFEKELARLLLALDQLVSHSKSQPQETFRDIPRSPPNNDATPILEDVLSDEEQAKAKLLAEEAVDQIIAEEDAQFENLCDIRFRNDDCNQVKGGSLERLVEKLTYSKLPASDYTSSFLLTYRSFTSSSELLSLLIKRYNIEPSADLDEMKKSIYFAKKIIPVRLRVFNVLKMWVKNNYQDFEQDPILLRTLFDFIPTMRADFLKGTTEFQSLLDRKAFSTETAPTLLMKNPAPPAILPRVNEITDILQLDPLEIARQITLMQWDVFYSIRPNEFLNQGWNRKELYHESPNVRRMIQLSNFIVQWVSSEIVSVATARGRAVVIKHFISTAGKLRDLNNFDGLKSILCGLQASGVRRLCKSWELVPSKHRLLMEELSELMSEEKSCKNYRHVLHTIDPPCLPFLGVYLTDLTMIETGNSDMLKEDPCLINFHKRYLIAQVIHELKRYQCTPYNLEKIPGLMKWIQSRAVMNCQEVYDQSLIAEPRTNASITSSSEDASNCDTLRKLSAAKKTPAITLNFSSFRHSSAN